MRWTGTSANNPDTNPTKMSNPAAYPGVTSFTGAQANDQYVAKHFPFPWFHSLTGDTTADGTQTAAHTTPAFSWITPNNCSDAHDAVCQGNNLSGAFDSTGNPIYQPGAPEGIAADAVGNQLFPGPGANGFIDRPPVCTSTAPNVRANCVPGIVRGGAGSPPSARTDAALGMANSTDILDPKIVATDTGRGVTSTDTTGPGGTSPIPVDSFVRAVSDTGQPAATSKSSVINGSFQLVDKSGTPVTPTGPVSTITLSAEGAPGYLAPGASPLRRG